MRELESINVSSFMGIIIITLFSFLFLMICVFVVKSELSKYDDKYDFILER